MIRLLIFVAIILLSFSSFAQGPTYFKIGTEEFSNADVYSLLYDDEADIIYASTNRGLYAYKQNKFNLIESKVNLAVNSLFQLQFNHKGEIFCCNLKGQVFKIVKGNLVLFYEMPKESKVQEFRYYFDTEDNLIVNTFSEIRLITESGEEKIIFNLNVLKQLIPTYTAAPAMYSHQINNGEIYFAMIGQTDFLIYKDGDITFHQLPNARNNTTAGFFQLGETVYFQSGGSSESTDGIENNLGIEMNKATSIVQLSANSIVLRSASHGFRFVELINGELKEISFGIDNSFISAITINKNGTIFLGTFKDGVYVIPNKDIRKFRSDYPFHGITSSSNNDVYLSNRKGQIFKHEKSYEPYGEFSYNISNLFYLEGEYYSGENQVNKIIHKEKNNSFIEHKFNNLKDVEEYKNEFVLLMSPKTINLILNDSLKNNNNVFSKGNEHKINSIYLENRGKSVTYIPEEKAVYYSTSNGVFKQKWNVEGTEELFFSGGKIVGNNITNCKRELIIGTERDGILFYKDKNFIGQLETKQGLKSNTILKLDVKDDLLFILSIKGIQVYDLIHKKFIYFGEREGVLSEQVINYSLSKDKLWLLDKKGYYAFDLNNFQKTKNVELGNLFLDSMIVNGNKVQADGTHRFSYDKKEVQFFFDYRDIETKTETKIRYKLLGASNEWKNIETSTNTISFPSLSSGRYTFIIKAVYRDIETDEKRIDFEILSPFWFQLWFIILVFLFILIIVSLFFFLRMRRNKKTRKIELEKQKLKTIILDSKLKAIRSQMNPHFIFNSLNSIQALVLKNDTKRSYDYIEMFSDLVRKTLDFSEKNYIAISEEINFLTIYLKLETLRMKKEFHFEIESDLKENIKVPTLLIQPFIENAIHHGLLHRKGMKELNIEFKKMSNSVQCIIVDNGVGRDKSNTINARQKYRHKSFSLNAIEERLYILGEQNNQTFEYLVEDLYENEVAVGTKVIVNFPFKNRY